MLLVRSPDVLERRFMGEEVVISPSSADVTSLQGTAVAVWDLLRTPWMMSDLVRRIAREFATSEGVVRPDVEALVDELIGRGLILEVNDVDD